MPAEKQSYKTIAVYLPDPRRAKRTLDVAVQLAQQNDAHLVGIFMMFPDILSPAFALGRSYMEQGKAALRERGRQVQAMFEAAGAGLSLKKEWRVVEPGPRPYLDVLMAHMRCADLIITPQRDPDWEDTLLMEYPEELLMMSGRPVLIIPNAGSFGDITPRVLLAWNERREAARAAFDALPILQRAEQVRVLWVNPDKDGAGDVPTAEISTSLARHGVTCTASMTLGSDLRAGDELLNQVSDHGATLLVMGGYGHNRFREYVFGGATRRILKHMTVPVLISH